MYKMCVALQRDVRKLLHNICGSVLCFNEVFTFLHDSPSADFSVVRFAATFSFPQVSKSELGNYGSD